MTVVLAMRCADGLVLAADSQITDSYRGLRYPARKLHTLGERAAWGGSGARAVLTELEGMFDAHPEAVVEAADVGHALQDHGRQAKASRTTAGWSRWHRAWRL